MTTATVSVMFTDMVGSTALVSRIGPNAQGEVRRTHFELLRGIVASFGGTEVKSEGGAPSCQSSGALSENSNAVERVLQGAWPGDPTRERVLDYATMIDRKLGVFFTPPAL